jgi:TRAP-type C4-dicarboxylate transport system substrate-binding protein
MNAIVKAAGGAMVAWLAASLAPSSAAAQQFTIKISSPTVNDVSHEWMKAFKSGVEGKSNGQIKVEMYPANQLGQIPATVEGVALGTIEVTIPATGFLLGLEPRFQIFDAPGLFDDIQQGQRVLSDPEFRKRLVTFGASKGVEPLVVYPHSPLMLLSHKPVRSIGDIRGQKIRVPGSAPLHIEPFKKLGASPVSMPLGEVISAMQNRAIDGLIAGASVFTAFKYYDIAKGLTALPGSFIIVAALTNRDFLKSLGPQREAMVREEALKAQAAVMGSSPADVKRTFDTWRQNGGEIIELGPEDAGKYREQVTSVLPPILAGNKSMKEDYDALTEAIKRQSK